MSTLSSNRDLYDYLRSLGAKLEQRGCAKLAKAVATAIGNAASSSTEFLGEARLALREVLGERQGALTKEERDEASNILKQVNEALNTR
jgi:hypothetical protein